MMTNFENITAPLNDIERKAAEIIAKGMLSHVGADHSVTASTIANGMAKNFADMRIVDARGVVRPYLTGPRIRKIMNYIRRNHLCRFLIASSDGYYLATDSNEVCKYIKSLDERIEAIQAMQNALKQELQTTH